jgi:hypothetical protein
MTMTRQICPDESCGKEFERPVVVKNFVLRPELEVYYACPYCLTRIEDFVEPMPYETSATESETDFEIESEEKQVEDFVEPMPYETSATESETDFEIGSEEKQIEPSIDEIEIMYAKEEPTIFENIQNLEKEKMDLLEQIDLLKHAAEKKMDALKEEISSLRTELEELKSFVE